ADLVIPAPVARVDRLEQGSQRGIGTELVLARVEPPAAVAEGEIGLRLAKVETQRCRQLRSVELRCVLVVARVDQARGKGEDGGAARTAIERIVAQRERVGRPAGRAGYRHVALGPAD